MVARAEVSRALSTFSPQAGPAKGRVIHQPPQKLTGISTDLPTDGGAQRGLISVAVYQYGARRVQECRTRDGWKSQRGCGWAWGRRIVHRLGGQMSRSGRACPQVCPPRALAATSVAGQEAGRCFTWNVPWAAWREGYCARGGKLAAPQRNSRRGDCFPAERLAGVVALSAIPVLRTSVGAQR